jgi:hypothetical protein
MRSLLLLFITLFIGAACNKKTASVTSGSVNANAPFIWETSFPKDMLISSEFNNPNETTKIDAMLNAWETSLNNYDFFTNAGTDSEKTDSITSSSQLRDNLFGIYKATSWPYPEYPDALAITQIFAIRYNHGESNEYVAMVEADIIMNYDNFLFDSADPSAFDYDFQTVLLHELGHFLGLQHKPRSYPRAQTVMYPSIFSQQSEVKQTPQTIDRQDLAAKYSITLPLTAAGSAIVGTPKSYARNPGTTGEMTKIILELRANGECIHHADGVEFTRHQMKK